MCGVCIRAAVGELRRLGVYAPDAEFDAEFEDVLVKVDRLSALDEVLAAKLLEMLLRRIHEARGASNDPPRSAI
jgi:hypothetical protein